ncbi:MAG: hypothetical protein U0167_07690 [bacterium]
MNRSGLGVLFAIALAGQVQAAQLCLAPSHPDGRNGSVGCDPESTFVDNHWIGFCTTGLPCATPGGCTFDDPPPALGSCWSISASQTVFDANVQGIFQNTSLYLWLVRTGSYGFASAEFYLAGDLHVIAVTARPGVVISHPGSDPREIRISVPGCPMGPVIAATVLVEGPVGVDPTTWGRVKALYT